LESGVAYFVVDVESNSNTIEMEVALDNLTYKCWGTQGEDPMATGTAELPSDAVISWLRAGDIAAGRPSLQTEAEDLVSLIDEIAAGVSPLEAGRNLTSLRAEPLTLVRRYRRLDPNAMAWVEVGIWTVVWLTGTLYLATRKTPRQD
jgi:hypothetical protein